MSEEEMYAMLQRLKKENKELRKSRNSLQTDNSLLSKIEGKLRYKMEILMKKLSHLQSDLPMNIQKKLSNASGGGGSIEETIDVLIEHVTWVSDRYVALEKEMKSAQQHIIQNMCQDLKEFALQHNLLQKNALRDEDWMPSQQKNGNDNENKAHPWQTLFKHMSSALQADNDYSKEALEWLRANATKYCDDKNDNLMDCVTCIMKNMQNEQSEFKASNDLTEKEKQKNG